MSSIDDILMRIKRSVYSTDPDAIILLYGSYARGDYGDSSDIDIIILLDKKRISREDEKRIKYPLYSIEFNTGRIISPIILTKEDWDNIHSATPLFENVQSEGIQL